MIDALERGYELGDTKYVGLLASLALVRHPLPKALQRPADMHYDLQSRSILGEIELPNFAQLRFRKTRSGKSHEVVAATAGEKKKAAEAILYAFPVRAAYLIAMSDIASRFDTVAINVRQQWFDPATGATCEGVVASLMAK